MKLRSDGQISHTLIHLRIMCFDARDDIINDRLDQWDWNTPLPAYLDRPLSHDYDDGDVLNFLASDFTCNDETLVMVFVYFDYCDALKDDDGHEAYDRAMKVVC